MTNKDLQERLDLLKWCASEKCGFDMSGYMDYCYRCKYLHGVCTIQPAERVDSCACAKAYRNKRKGD